MKKLFIANIDFSVTPSDLEQAFGEIGRVAHSKIVLDRETGRSRGFGFVEFETPEDARQCKEQMNGYEFNGRKIIIDWARDR